MQKILLTSPKFEGHIEMVFKEDVLAQFSFFQSKGLSIKQRDYFLKNCPVRLPDMESFIKGTKLTAVSEDYEITFDMFWKKYNRKVDRKRAQRVWDRLNKANKIKAYFGIDKYERYLRRTATWRNKMEPKTYLLNERWEDEW